MTRNNVREIKTKLTIRWLVSAIGW